MDLKLVEKLQEMQRRDSRYVKGFIDKRTYITDIGGVDKVEKEKYIELVKSHPEVYALRDDDRTYKFLFTPSNSLLLGSWENDHFHQNNFIRDKYDLKVEDLKHYFKGRLVVDPLATWLYLYQREDQKPIPSWVVEDGVSKLRQVTGQHIEFVIDDKKNILQERRKDLDLLLQEGKYVEFMKKTLPNAWKSWKVMCNTKVEKELLENKYYNEYWKIRLFDVENWHKFLRENRERINELGNLSYEDRIKIFLNENKIREVKIKWDY